MYYLSCVRASRREGTSLAGSLGIGSVCQFGVVGGGPSLQVPLRVPVLDVSHTGLAQDVRRLLLVEAKAAAQVGQQQRRVGLGVPDGLVGAALQLGPEAGQLAGHIPRQDSINP